MAIQFYNKSLQSPGVDTATRMANYRELADYYFEKGVYLNTGAYLDSLLRVIPQEGRLKKTTQRERDGLDEVIELETIIRSTDSILSLTALDFLSFGKIRASSGQVGVQPSAHQFQTLRSNSRFL